MRGWLLQPCRPARGAQTWQRDILLKANRHIHQISFYVLWNGGSWGVSKPFAWKQLGARWEMRLGAGSDLKGRKEEKHKNKRDILSTWAENCPSGQAGLFHLHPMKQDSSRCW